MSAKIISFRGATLILAFALVLTGCKPTGTSALLRGKKYLDRGDYDAAATQFQTATTLLATNAAAWNYYGVALQHAGKPIEAATAYQHALELERDFPEARLNLGTLWLEQNKPEDAKTEFTAYTLRWPNDSTGWLKLGSARLRLGETVPAERSFSTVLALKTNEAEAYNGLGMARIQRGKPREAAQFFVAALQLKPDFAAARLNLATVDHQYLNDDKSALENYRAWLAIEPHPENWDEVKAFADNLEKSLLATTGTTTAAAPATTPAPAKPEPVPATPTPAPATPPATVAEAKPQTKAPPATPVRAVQSPRAQSANPPAISRPTSPTPASPVEVVQVPPETSIVTTPNTTGNPKTTTEISSTASDNSQSLPSYAISGVTPLPGNSTASRVPATVETPKPKPVKIIPPAPVNFPHYNYLSPRKPAPGDRKAASGAFSRAQTAEQNQNWAATLNAYREAANLDPAWFEAQYNAGVIAQNLQNYPSALASYEMALALQPGSVNARYNFALTLKAAGYVPDAVEELKKILTANPREVRAHLALANLCAQQLHDPAQAREHYLKVLELDPKNPESTNIRFWLAANPAG